MKIDILPVVNQIVMLFLLMSFGLMLRKMHIFSDAVIKGVNALMMTVTWPALMISSTQKPYTDEALHSFLLILGVSVLLLSTFSLLVYVLLKKRKPDKAAVMSMLSIMPNVGYFGIPIVDALYGAQGLLLLTAYILGFNLVLWTVSIFMFTGFRASALKNLVNPGILCALVGFSLFICRITLPAALGSTASQLAIVNTPLSMLILGARIDALRPKALLDRNLWIATATKLVLFPLAALLLLRACGLTGMPLIMLTCGAAMPAAASTQMLTEKYGGDVYFSAKGTSVSTICSLLTLPLVLLIAGMIA